MCRVCYLCGNMRSVCVWGYENAVCGGVCCMCVSWGMSCLPVVCAYALCAVSLILCATVYCMGDCLSDILWHMHITHDILCRGCVLPHVGVLVFDVCEFVHCAMECDVPLLCVYVMCCMHVLWLQHANCIAVLSPVRVLCVPCILLHTSCDACIYDVMGVCLVMLHVWCCNESCVKCTSLTRVTTSQESMQITCVLTFSHLFRYVCMCFCTPAQVCVCTPT